MEIVFCLKKVKFYNNNEKKIEVKENKTAKKFLKIAYLFYIQIF